MKLHGSVVQKLAKMLELYGGRQDETKLLKMLGNLDFSVYKQEATTNSVLVLTEELNKEKQKLGR